MAGPHIKTTMHFQVDRYSWSESYLLLTDSTIGSGPLTRARNLARARLLMMGGNVGLQAVILSVEERPANPATTGDSKPLVLSTISTSSLPILASVLEPTLANVKAAPPESAIRVRCSGADANHTKMIYFAGCPQFLFTTSPPGPNYQAPGAGKWVQAFTAFVNLLTGQGAWGFWARVRTGGSASPQVVQRVQQSTLPSGYWGVVTTTTGFLLSVGSTIQLKGFRHKGCPKCRWQGMWRIAEVDTTTTPGERVYYLANSQSLDPETIDKTGTIQEVAYQGIPIAEVDNPVQGHRKRGVGYGAPAGKSKKTGCCAV